jgi:hypothetical protein
MPRRVLSQSTGREANIIGVCGQGQLIAVTAAELHDASYAIIRSDDPAKLTR